MKVQSKDLRIGNLVFSKETQENQIINGIDSEYVYLDCITFDYQTLEDIEPIPLTEEWLLKMGFEEWAGIGYKAPTNTAYWHFSIGLDFIPTIWTGNTITTDGYRGCKYVHQLQNLFFALTQKELTI